MIHFKNEPLLNADYYPTSTMACSDGDTRLENSTYSFKDGVFVYGGRVEVCYRGTFHPVCDEGWTDDDAAVVCNYIGYTTVYHSELILHKIGNDKRAYKAIP